MGQRKNLSSRQKSGTHDFPHRGWALYPLSYENPWRARSFNRVHMWQACCILREVNGFDSCWGLIVFFVPRSCVVNQFTLHIPLPIELTIHLLYSLFSIYFYLTHALSIECNNATKRAEETSFAFSRSFLPHLGFPQTDQNCFSLYVRIFPTNFCASLFHKLTAGKPRLNCSRTTKQSHLLGQTK